MLRLSFKRIKTARFIEVMDTAAESIRYQIGVTPETTVWLRDGTFHLYVPAFTHFMEGPVTFTAAGIGGFVTDGRPDDDVNLQDDNATLVAILSFLQGTLVFEAEQNDAPTTSPKESGDDGKSE